MVFVIVGTIFALYGLKIFLFGQTRMHRFERWRGMLTIDSKGLFRSRRRELPLDSIADIVLEEIRGRGSMSYYIHYVTATGKRIQVERLLRRKGKYARMLSRAREFLGIADAAASVKDKPTRG